MKAYIEEGAWLVCSYDLAGAPQQLQRHLSDESHRVQHISGKRLLTVEDKNTKDCFKCKLPVKQWSGLAALVGGMAVGAAIVLSGPVGWVALGAVAAVAIAGTVAYFAHDCAGPQKDGDWQDFHPTVTIKGESAILYQHSMLNCKQGGILIAFESFEVAQTTADKANNYAWGEIGLQVLSNALIGGFSGYFAGSKLDAVITAGVSTVSYGITDFAIPNASPIVANAIGLFMSTKYGNLFPNGLRGKNFDMRAFRLDFVFAVGGFASDVLEGAMAESARQEVGNATQKEKYHSAGKSVISTAHSPSSYKPEEKFKW